MKHLLYLGFLTLLIASCSSTNDRSYASKDSNNPIEVYMSPTQGKEAFEKMYNMIKTAKKEVSVTVYSWSDTAFTKALRESLSQKNPPIVRVVIKKDLYAKQVKAITELEKMGAMFKSAKIQLHEKFVLVDGIKLVNSSANMSNGAKYKYSENFVFFDGLKQPKGSDIAHTLNQFKKEFSIIWNSAHDIKTQGEVRSAGHLQFSETETKTDSDIIFYSSSMNYKVTTPNKRDKAKGSTIGLKRIPNKKNQIWTVKDALIKTIRSAKKNILLNINHFNIREISDELIEAVKRGVDVKLAVDAQEFKTYINNKEMTPQFVSDYVALKGSKAEIPVRVKFYSFVPHFSSWSLNHHKYIMIDYDQDNPEQTKLLTGSYNYSKTAEHSKFDNQVLFQGKKYAEVFDAFFDEFDYLWKLERTSDDKPKQASVDYFLKPKKGFLPLHSGRSVSLTWKEAKKLKQDITRAYPDAKTFYKFKHCYFFNVKEKVFYNQNKKTVCK